MDLFRRNIIVLDLETLHSADSLPTGWNDKKALDLSIGAYWDYQDGRIHWFDRASLEATMRYLVERQPLMVSFNGIGFDFSLMRALLRQEAETFEGEAYQDMNWLCERFKTLAATSYDILAEIWAVDSEGKFVRGLNSLDAILAANNLGKKTGDGAK
jgi:hypothetical protein